MILTNIFVSTFLFLNAICTSFGFPEGDQKIKPQEPKSVHGTTAHWQYFNKEIAKSNNAISKKQSRRDGEVEDDLSRLPEEEETLSTPKEEAEASSSPKEADDLSRDDLKEAAESTPGNDEKAIEVKEEDVIEQGELSQTPDEAKTDDDKMPMSNNKSPFFDKMKGGSMKKYHSEKFKYVHDHSAMNWPLGIIPYHLDSESYDTILATRVRTAMDYLETVSCLQFKSVGPDDDAGRNFTWIHITNRAKQRECTHNTKTKKGGQIELILGLDCLKQRDVLHSLLHAIGFKDEVTHPHRDQYIRIMWDNIQPKYRRLFRLAAEDAHNLVEYDPMSVMHFHDRAFSSNGRATITPLMAGLQIEPSEKLSQLDKMKLRLTFGHECSRRTVDDLFDTCKTVLHDEIKVNGSEKQDTNPSKESSDNDVNSDNGKIIEISNDEKNSKDEKDTDEEDKGEKKSKDEKDTDEEDKGENKKDSNDSDGSDGNEETIIHDNDVADNTLTQRKKDLQNDREDFETARRRNEATLYHITKQWSE